MAEVSEVAKHGHESFRFERERVDVDGEVGGCVGCERKDDVFVDDLVGEEGGDDGEEAGDEVVCADDVEGDAGDGEELESEVFDGGFGFAVGEEVGVDDAVVDVGKVPGWGRG
jgi:hypothetical protein